MNQQILQWLEQRVVRRETAAALNLDFQYELGQGYSQHVGTSTVDTWVRQDLGEWTAMMRMVPSKNGNPLVAELRVFPRESDAERRRARLAPDEWSGCYVGNKALVPGSGLSARALRGVLFAEATRETRAHYRTTFDSHKPPPGFELVVWPKRPASRGRRGGRRKLTDESLVRLAAVYAYCNKKNPVEFAAKRLGVTRSQARDWLRAARKRGLLEPAEGTRPLGELTGKGKAVLNTIVRNARGEGSQAGPKRE